MIPIPIHPPLLAGYFFMETDSKEGLICAKAIGQH